LFNVQKDGFLFSPFAAKYCLDSMIFKPDSQSAVIFNQIFSLYGTISPDGSIVAWSGSVFKEVVTDPQLLVGHRFSETVYWQSAPHVPAAIRQAVEDARNGRELRIQTQFRVSAVKVIDIELNLTPLRDDSGEVAEVFFGAIDVTPREREIAFYKERGEHLVYAAESANVGLWYWDLLGPSSFSTPICNELFDVPAGEILSDSTFHKIIHPDDREKVDSALRDSLAFGREYNLKHRVIRSDGTITTVGVRGKTFRNAENVPFCIMGTVRKVLSPDVSAAGENGTAINGIVSEDAALRAQVAAEKARTEAEDANKMKDHFLAIVSHELRAPLNAILGWAKILLTKEVDDKTRHSALETIERSARSQSKLIDDLVDSARIASGKLKLEMRPINLGEILQNVYNSQKPSAEARGIRLEYVPASENVEVFGDSVRLQQVFTNLLTNAIKFTEEGGSVSIGVNVSDDGAASVVIRDNGRGMSPELLPLIFRQFAQGSEKISGNRGGLGLGLSIVKTLVEKHAGTVVAHSEGPGKGSEFTVTLPILPVNTETTPVSHASKPASGADSLKGIRILLVEDDRDSRDVLTLFLEQNGAIVSGVESVQAALGIMTSASDQLPEVLISDLAMPVEDGYSLIAKIRSFPPNQGGNIPAMALSAFATAENKERAFQDGFQKYHTKPFDPDLIIREIREMISR
jgi:signal transduction histidine kinase/CheY-like chemotaxis protein